LAYLNGGNALFEDLFAGGVELMLDVDVGGAQARVDALAFGVLEGFGGTFDVSLDGAGQGADHRVGHGAGYFHHRVEVAGAGDGEAGLDDVHAQGFEFAGNFNLFGGGELAARYLFAVAQGGIENVHFFAHTCAFFAANRFHEKGRPVFLGFKY
jgi:hypothetical protein